MAASGGAVLHLLLAYLLCSLVLLYCVSVLALAVPKRADHYFYGRYNEVLMPAMTVVALSFMWRAKAGFVRYTILCAILPMLAMALVIAHYPATIFDMRVQYGQVSGWYIHRHGVWKINPLTIMYSVAACQLVLGLLLPISRRLFLVSLVVFNGYVSVYLFMERHMKIDQGTPNWREFAALEEKLDGRLDGHSIKVIGGKPNRPMALQFALPQSRVIFGDPGAEKPDALLDYTGRLCQPGRVLASVRGAALCYRLP
jgi:hypothetical protein